MRTEIDLDPKLFAEAARITGLKNKSAIIHAGLKWIVERDAARQLIALGGTMPDAWAAPRRRTKVTKRAPRKR